MKVKGQLLNPVRSDKGYLVVSLYKRNKCVQKEVQRVVLEAFVGKCPKGEQGCHNNGDPLDNRLKNLRYDTVKNNNADKYVHGTQKVGKDHHASKLSPEDIVAIRKEYAEQPDLGCPELAKRYGVHPTAIHNIVKRKCWRHLDDEGHIIPLEERSSYRSRRLTKNKMALRFKAFGKTLTLKEWAEEVGVAKSTLWARLQRGWGIEETLMRKVD